MIPAAVRTDLAWFAVSAVAGLLILWATSPVLQAVGWVVLVGELVRAVYVALTWLYRPRKQDW